jgi:polyphosphate kinase
VLKMNSLNDGDIIEALYVASGMGVQIDLIVRGICCLRPGVKGLSENIRVRSVVGRFLEHSRVWRFANGAGEGKPEYFIGSADMMPRNLDGRVEAVVPVTDPGSRRHIDHVIQTLLSDTRLAWTLDAQGSWTKVEALSGVVEEIDAHRQFQQVAITRSEAPV